MPRFRAIGAIGALCALPVTFALAEGADLPGGRSYRMYRNPPKPLITILPVTGRGLDQASAEAFDQVMAAEALRLPGYRLLPLPHDVRPDSQGMLPAGALLTLHKRYRVAFVLRARLEKSQGRTSIHAEVLDLPAGNIRAEHRGECLCPIEGLAARVVPETMRRLAEAPRILGRKCGEGMAAIPGTSRNGAAGADVSRRKQGPGAFCMDVYEFPNEPAGEPVVARTWSDADSLCAERGKRLCTEAEWELACGGWQGQAYPYGNGYIGTRCNTESATIQLSGDEIGCRSPFGIYDLSGNVFEWTATQWSSRYRDKVVKGGNWSAGPGNSSCTARFGQPLGTESQAIGFRCCRSLPP